MPKIMWKALDNLSPSNIKLSQLPRKPNGLYNMHLNEYGQIVKRAGHTLYDEISSNSPKIVGMHRYCKKNEDKIFLVAWNKGIYNLPDDLSDAILIKALTADSDTYFADFNDRSYFVNGVDGVYKCTLTNAIAGTRNDTTFTRTDGGTWIVDALIDQYVFSYVDTTPATGTWAKITDNDTNTITISETLHASANRIKILIVKTVGITKPDAPEVELTGSDSSLGEGVYKFCYTYIDDDGYESNPSDESNEVTVTSNKEHITVPLSGTDYRKNVYRTPVNGEIFYKDNIDAIIGKDKETYDSERADNTLGKIVKVNHDAPEATSHLITKRRNKLYLAYQDYVYPSHISDVEYFPPLWRQRTGNSQKITGLLEQLTALPVATMDSIERLVGTDEDNTEFRNSYSTEGCIAIRSYVNCDNLIVYLGHNGINYFDGVDPGVFSEVLNKYIRDKIVKAYAHLSCATYWDNKYILCYPKKDGTYPTETIWYDLKNKTYGVYSFAFSCFSIWDKGDDGLQLKGGSNTIGQVYSVFNGLDDVGSDIEAYDRIEYLDFGIPDREKHYYKIYIRAEVTSESTLTVYYKTDIDAEADVTTTLTAKKDQWYVLNLPESVGGRAIKIRPRVNNKLAVTFKGYMIQYDVEALKV